MKEQVILTWTDKETKTKIKYWAVPCQSGFFTTRITVYTGRKLVHNFIACTEKATNKKGWYDVIDKQFHLHEFPMPKQSDIYVYTSHPKYVSIDDIQINTGNSQDLINITYRGREATISKENYDLAKKEYGINLFETMIERIEREDTGEE